jgi:hypothetical protein
MKIDAATIERLQPWFEGLDLTRVRLVYTGPVCWYVRNVAKQGAMTIAPFIFYGRTAYDPARLGSVALLAHELKHVEQYKRYGHALFLARYLIALAKARFHYSRELPLEVEAYELQDEVRARLRAYYA